MTALPRMTPLRLGRIGLAAAIAVAILTPPFHADAQAPSSVAPAQPASSPTASPQSGASGSDLTGSKFLGRDTPFFNPGTEVLSWDGKNWNISDNRLFQARFEKYLNAPEETSADDKAYQELLQGILDRLAPGRATPAAVDEAFQMLPRASNYAIDANLCDALANAVYSVWLAQRNQQRLEFANKSLETERKSQEWNSRLSASSPGDSSNPPTDPAQVSEWYKEQALKRELRMQPYTSRLAEINALIQTNKAKRELSQLQAKLEFQSLLVQLFLQRRFQHVLMGTRFYRAVFSDGDTALRFEGDAKSLFANSTGLPPTVGLMDSMANEAIRDATEGIQAYEFLLGKNELESATKRLGEAFVIGEYLPALRTLPREKKRTALAFVQKSNQLLSALEVRDLSLAEKLVRELEAEATDFDNSQAMAAIETARTVSNMHLAKARNAAVSGDRTTVETELKAATEMWPRNPRLAEVSTLIFDRADVQQQAVADLDRLLSQKNYRQIYEDRVRFIAATAMFPDKQEALTKALEDIQEIEGALMRAREIAKRGDPMGAWESTERASRKYPSDNALNQLHAELTTRAADFVRSLRNAQEFEDQDQRGSSLAWYLKAQDIYPPSEFAREGVDRLVAAILPASSQISGPLSGTP